MFNRTSDYSQLEVKEADMTLEIIKNRAIKGGPKLEVIKKIQCLLTALTRELINITTWSLPLLQSTALAYGIGLKGLYLQALQTLDIYVERDT